MTLDKFMMSLVTQSASRCLLFLPFRVEKWLLYFFYKLRFFFNKWIIKSLLVGCIDLESAEDERKRNSTYHSLLTF